MRPAREPDGLGRRLAQQAAHPAAELGRSPGQVEPQRHQVERAVGAGRRVPVDHARDRSRPVDEHVLEMEVEVHEVVPGQVLRQLGSGLLDRGEQARGAPVVAGHRTVQAEPGPVGPQVELRRGHACPVGQQAAQAAVQPNHRLHRPPGDRGRRRARKQLLHDGRDAGRPGYQLVARGGHAGGPGDRDQLRAPVGAGHLVRRCTGEHRPVAVRPAHVAGTDLAATAAAFVSQPEPGSRRQLG